MKSLQSLITIGLLTITSWAQAASVLVVLSDTDTLELKNGKTFTTGFYLNEAMQPVKMLIDAGHQVTFTTPTGRAPTVDKNSVAPNYFNNDGKALQAHQNLLDKLAITSPTKSPVISLTRVAQIGYDQFDAVLVPGGHAPMQDLSTDKELGKLLAYFHARKKPTALICHGPIALISTLDNATAFTSTLAAGDKTTAEKEWIYADYKLTVFSNNEEEASKAQLKGGEMKYYPETALHQAGAKIVVEDLWQANVIEDRELITGQNPASAVGVGKRLLEKLKNVK